MFPARPRTLRSTASLALIVWAALLTSACGSKVNSVQSASRAVDPYCSLLPSKTFNDGITVSGKAVYEYRVGGNGVASDSGAVFQVASFATAAERQFSLEINSRLYSVSSGLNGSALAGDVVAKFKSAINADTAAGLYAYGTGQLTVTHPAAAAAPSIGALTHLHQLASNPDPRPVRQAELAVIGPLGEIVQCAETDDQGNFAISLPRDHLIYIVELRSRASNARNRGYVLDNPGENRPHSVQLNVVPSHSQSGLLLRARIVGGLKAGAFNILDQLLNAQDHLRQSTEACDVVGSAHYFPGCTPFVGAPLVTAFWSPGLSPSVYLNSSGPISFYMTGLRELYILGGVAGNTTSSDMDHFDNSVILHEYAHFLEDMFGSPNSPGGSHNGDAIIDPRLAWGEGFANYFQAVVTGVPVYRDTYGTPDCPGVCAGAFFNESLDPAGRPGNDAPTAGALGEGNFREFSVSRLLWDATKTSGGVTSFAELWRVFLMPSIGLKDVDDPFKSIGRFHAIQSNLAGATDWSAIRSSEEQSADFSLYATPISVLDRSLAASCTRSPTSLAPFKAPWDSGAFATADQFRNSDFYRLDHPGGPLLIELFYSKDMTNPPDLDLFLYRSDYAFGRTADMALSSAFLGDGCPGTGDPGDQGNGFRAQNGCPIAPPGLSSTFGYERMSGSAPQGTYMLNVYADVGVRAGAASQYVIILNGQLVCPQP